MDVDRLIERLQELQAQGLGHLLVMVPSDIGREYTPSDAYEFDNKVHIN